MLSLTRGLRRVTALGAGLALVVLTVGALAGCNAGGGSSSGGGTSAADRDLRVGLILEPRSLDFTTDDGAAIPQALLVNVYEGLVKLDTEGRVEPLLAKRWTVSRDRRVYTFELHDNVRFTNGARFTAEDAAFSIDRVKSSAWKPQVKAGMDVVDKAEALSPTRLRVTLKQPSNLWLYRMTTRIGAMFSRTGMKNLATKPIGTGPYMLKKWQRGNAITLEKNPKYWGAKPSFDEVVLRYFKNPNAMNNSLRSGGIDVISTVQTPDSLGQFADKSKYRVIEGTTNGEVVLSFNNGAGPLKDKRVRQAVKYALNHKALLDSAWSGRGVLIGSMVVPTDPWFEDLTGRYPHNPALARKLLAQAGQRDLKLRLRIPTLPYAESSAQVVKSQLAEVGITVDIDPLEFPRWLDQVFTNADYDMSIVAHVEGRDIVSWGNPKYYWRYDNPRLRKLFAEADSGPEAQQTAKMREAARLLAEDAAGDWLFMLPNLLVAKPDVVGLPKNVVSEAFDLTTLSRR